MDGVLAELFQSYASPIPLFGIWSMTFSLLCSRAQIRPITSAREASGVMTFTYSSSVFPLFPGLAISQTALFNRQRKKVVLCFEGDTG